MGEVGKKFQKVNQIRELNFKVYAPSSTRRAATAKSIWESAIKPRN
jgi:hypothetical protein